VLEQSRTADEIIVVNDGEKHEVFKEFESLANVRIFHNEAPKGANFSRNRGAEYSEGNILMFLDDDDTWKRSKIEDQLKVFQLNKDVDLVFSGREVVYSDNRNRTIYNIDAIVPQKNTFKNILQGNFIGTTSSVAIRRKIFFDVGKFDENLPAMQDYDLWIRVCRASKIKSDDKHNVIYTITKGDRNKRISNSGINQINASRIILEKYMNDFQQEKIHLRKRKSRFFFYIAKSIREKSLIKALPWITKSFLLFPNLQSIYLVFSTKAPNLR